MKRGEVWRVLIPSAPGHAQTGERPAIILQELVFNNSLPTTLIVPLKWHSCFKCATWTSEIASSLWEFLTRPPSTKSSRSWIN